MIEAPGSAVLYRTATGLERSMAERAVAIAAARIEVVERLDGALAEGVGPFPRAALKLEELGWENTVSWTTFFAGFPAYYDEISASN